MELTKHSGNWLLMDGTEKTLTANAMTEKRELRSCDSENGNQL
jgi:hypothetical protein